MATLLLADDDAVLSDLLREFLESQGFTVDVVGNGRAAVAAVAAGGVDLVVLDVMMPELDGFEALREIRQHSQVPIIMLTARGDDIDRIVGLEMGADDYLPKPCNPRELAARVRAILRRAQADEPSDDVNGMVTVADVTLDPATRSASLAGAPLVLTSTEFNVLIVLMQHVGEVVTKAVLCEAALGRKLALYDRSTDMHVSNLRKKLGEYADGTTRIKTVRGQGYLYAPNAGGA
ncbi:MAG: response regulator [Pseudomonadota bacterium]